MKNSQEITFNKDLLLIDIGGTEIKLARLASGQQTLEKLPSLETRASEGAARMLERLMEHIKNYDFQAIGIATAGQVDVHDGSILYANPNIPAYKGMPLRTKFAERFAVPVCVENDVNAAALGELYFGIGRSLGIENFLCITVGTGIGGAIIKDKKLHRGYYGGAGEFGHLITHADVRLKSDGKDELAGCYESYASTSALVKTAMKYDERLSDGRKVFAHFDDPQVKKMIDEWIGEMAMGLVSLIHALSPEMIIFAGGIMREPYIIETLNDLLERHVFPSFWPVKLRRAELGSDANLWGAAVPFIEKFS